MNQRLDLINCHDIAFGYSKSSNLFNNLNLKIKNGEFTFITGPSGTGKTSLLKLIYGALKPNSGTLSVFGVNMHNMSQNDLVLVRQSFGIVFQDSRLINHLTALDNVALTMKIMGKSFQQARYIAREFLDWINLGHICEKYPNQLSTGQRQRVALARGIIHRPIVILADEPTGNLDQENALEILQLLHNISKGGSAVLCVTHNEKLINHFKHPVLKLDQYAAA